MVSVIIVNYNTTDLVNQCISSFKQYHDINRIKYEIIVVDNNPEDSGCSLIKEQNPEVNIIRSGYNAGYAIGNNLGIRESTGHSILVINPDIIFIEEVLSRCLTLVKTNGIGIIGCRLLNQNKTHQVSVYYSVASLKNIFEENYIIKKFFIKNKNSDKKIKAMMGAFLFFPRSVINKIGLFDEQFFIYGEEIEWMHRARCNNIKLMYAPSFSVIHLKGASNGSVRLTLQKYVSHLLLVKKMRGKWFLILFQLIAFLSILSQFPFYFFYNREGRNNLKRHFSEFFMSLPWTMKIIILPEKSIRQIKVIN